MTAPTRRAALGALAVVPALALPAVAIAAAAPPDADAELIALAAEIDRLCALNHEIYAKRIDPFHETFEGLMDEALVVRADQTDFKARWDKAWEYSRESGREAGIGEADAVDK